MVIPIFDVDDDDDEDDHVDDDDDDDDDEEEEDDGGGSGDDDDLTRALNKLQSFEIIPSRPYTRIIITDKSFIHEYNLVCS